MRLVIKSPNGTPLLLVDVEFNGTILNKLEELKMDISEVAAAVDAITTQVVKAKDEITTRIAELEAALGNTALPAEAVTALDNLKAAVQAVDDINPDAPVV